MGLATVVVLFTSPPLLVIGLINYLLRNSRWRIPVTVMLVVLTLAGFGLAFLLFIVRVLSHD